MRSFVAMAVTKTGSGGAMEATAAGGVRPVGEGVAGQDAFQAPEGEHVPFPGLGLAHARRADEPLQAADPRISRRASPARCRLP